jgi:hypothetical protein
LDIARLVNLWLCRISNPAGSLIEVGSYKGGGASIFRTAAWISLYLFAIRLKGSATCRWIQVSTIFSLKNVFPTQVLNWSSRVGVTKREMCGGYEAVFQKRGGNFLVAMVVGSASLGLGYLFSEDWRVLILAQMS